MKSRVSDPEKQQKNQTEGIISALRFLLNKVPQIFIAGKEVRDFLFHF
jgi:hypothetical protein